MALTMLRASLTNQQSGQKSKNMLSLKRTTTPFLKLKLATTVPTRCYPVAYPTINPAC
ncbi:hypothetical protein EMIT043CA1_100139 [Pseudomonas brassicacearum]